MMRFSMRFDFRNPTFARTTMGERYRAALDMAEWADDLGCASIAVSEHHSSPDGYLPSPIPLLAAIAARTTRVRLMIAALIAPLHDPLRLAEDLIAIDNLSGGRVDVVLAGGYVAEEFAMFGVASNQRGAKVEETISVLMNAFAGLPFQHRGRVVTVTPPPDRTGGPTLLLGGSSATAAKRAARLGVGFIPSIPDVWAPYRDEVLALGRPDPGPCPIGPNRVTMLAEDPDSGWDTMAPYFLHETNAYGTWSEAAGLGAPFTRITDVDTLRTAGQYRVLTPEDYVDELRATIPYAVLHPMCGGLPPTLAWSSLRLFEQRILPEFETPQAAS